MDLDLRGFEAGDHVPIRDQAACRWLNLRGELVAFCIALNQKAGWPVLRWDDNPNPLRVWREDGADLTIFYMNDFHRVNFSDSSKGWECDYELRIKRESNRASWFGMEKSRSDTDESIAELMIRKLLRS